MGKGLHTRETNMNIPVRTIVMLICAALCLVALIAGLSAKFATSEPGGDGARVAKFSITGDCVLTNSVEASLVPGGSTTANLTIENKSEVAVEYTIEIANKTMNLPLEFELEKELEKKEDGSSTDSTFESVSGSDPSKDHIVFTEQKIAGKHTTDNYRLTIKWPTKDEAKAADLERMGMVDHVAVTITAAQID